MSSTASASIVAVVSISSSPSSFVRIEAEALLLLAERLDTTLGPLFEQALTLAAQARLVAVTGVGKSGIIARKIAATLTSTGTPAFFLHPTDALHGDLGLLAPGDLLLALSYSGETEELLRLLPVVTRMAVPVVAFTGCPASTLGALATLALDTSVSAEACHNNLAPTASTTAMLALGDALALELSRRSGFAPQHFADLHPGGRLGLRLARVRDLMHTGDALPRVAPETPMPQVIHEMSHKKLGMTTVVLPGNRLAGIISDGDLRRLFERLGPQSLKRTAGDIMNPRPRTIVATAFAAEALEAMEQQKITSLVVTQADGTVEGVLHLHDLWQSP